MFYTGSYASKHSVFGNTDLLIWYTQINRSAYLEINVQMFFKKSDTEILCQMMRRLTSKASSIPSSVIVSGFSLAFSTASEL